MAKIENIHAREIIDSRGNPTVEVEVRLDSGVLGRAAVPSGASTGAHEAHELRDGDKNRYHGKGVMQAIKNIGEIVSPELIGMNPADLEKIDQTLIALDGTENKSNLGANCILGVSMATAKAAALHERVSLFRFISDKQDHFHLPVPLMNVLNGGAHANNGLDVQEFMIAPVFGDRFSEALRAGSEIFHSLKKILDEKGLSTAVGDEGGFAPKLQSNEQALDLLCMAIEKSGYKVGDDIKLALDVAATELYQQGSYTWEGKALPSHELGEVYAKWANKYPLVSIEDGFAEDDWDGWITFTKSYGQRLQLVGDDLFVTHPRRIKLGIEKGAANALLVKVNQIGTLTETSQAVKLAQNSNFRTVMSHRSGETEDTTISDLCVGMHCEQIKTGSLCRGERTAKYNQLLRIEEELGAHAKFIGRKAFRV